MKEEKFQLLTETFLYLSPLNMSTTEVNPQKIVDLLINNVIISRLGDVLSSTFDLSLKNLFKLLILMSVGEIKSSILEFMPKLKEFLVKLPQYRNVLWLYWRPAVVVTAEYKFSSYKNIELKKLATEFYASLYMFLMDKAKLVRKINYISPKDKKIVIDEELVGVSFLFNDVKVKLAQSLKYRVEKHEDKVKNVEFLGVGAAIKSYPDIFPRDIAKLLKQAFEVFKKELPVDYDSGEYDQYLKDTYDPASNEQCYYVDLICKKYSLEVKEVYTYCSIIYELLRDYSTQVCWNSDTKEFITVFDPYNYYPRKILPREGLYKIKFRTHDFYDLTQHLKTVVRSGKKLKRNSEENSELTLQFPLSAPAELLATQILNQVTKYKVLKDNSIKIFYLDFIRKEQETEIDNPEYLEFLNKKEILKEFVDKEKGSALDITTIPSKKLIKKTPIKEVEVKELNQISKSIETLYLQKKDYNKLLNSLYQFRDKKEILKELGLQNKLNILLYGEPGTGKSTTIQAIATYLNRDIYYIDLKKAETNNDLQMMFDFVNKKINSGLIVMEDIDAMTNIVLKRENKIRELTTNEVMNNEHNSLSLEYFLNILQGTLTAEDSIFVVTTNYLDHLDPAFYRDGRFDVKVKLGCCDHYQIERIFEKIIGRSISKEVLEKIPEYTFTPASIIYHAKNYIFNTEMSDEEIMKEFIV